VSLGLALAQQTLPPVTNVLRYNVAPVIRPEVGAAMDLAVDETQQVLGDLSVEYVRGVLRLTRTNRRILISGTLQTAVAVECVRCLVPFQLTLTLPLEEQFALSPAIDPVYYIAEGGWLSLGPPLREQILLAMPIHLVCRPECQGLCVDCGQNLNDGPCSCGTEGIDPRLAALKSLLR
jgi:uncharacterized protein